MNRYEKQQFEVEIYLKLKEAEQEAETTDKRYSHDEVFTEMRKLIEVRK